nr:SprT family zinc-dependent metalloprotease [Sphingomonas montana]
MTQAKVMRLRIDPRDRSVRLTMPARGPLKPALAWVESKRDWIEAQLAAIPDGAAIGPGATIPYEDGALPVLWSADGPRTPRRAADGLQLGGPVELVGRRVLRWLAAEAGRVLDAETREYAALAGVTVGSVGIGDARSRWGSCSTGGDIRYSWRLILAPPAVRRATVAHEVAHRIHMDHSPAFHAAVARLYGRDPRVERDWLRRNGAVIQAYGRQNA